LVFSLKETTMVSGSTVNALTKVEPDHIRVRRPGADVIVLDESPKGGDEDEFFDFTDSEEKSVQKETKERRRQRSPENKRGRARKYDPHAPERNNRRSPRRNDVGSQNHHSSSKGFELQSDSGSDVVFIGDNRKELQERRRRHRSSRYSRERSSSRRRRRRRDSDRHYRRSGSTDRDGYRRRRSRSRRQSRERSRESRRRSGRVSRFSNGPSANSEFSIKPETIKPESVKPELIKPEGVKPEGMKPEPFLKAEAFCGNCGQRGHLTRWCPNKQTVVNLDIICFACGKQGHDEENCTRDVLGVLKRLKRQQKEAEEMKDRICHNCGEKGHTKKYCKNETKEWRQCHNCGERGHLKMECTNPTNPDLNVANRVKCFNCGDRGHIRKHCPDVDKGPKCYKCFEFGHIATSCEKEDINVRAPTEPNSQGQTNQTNDVRVNATFNRH